ncbi:MAG: hypothetical protein C4586_05685 [Anaerolineaceae bacterium]|nr:MAG: hypothetical protein C4586_05685 [Anaerolineaceae bacterium]
MEVKNKHDLVAPIAPPNIVELPFEPLSVKSLWQATLVGLGIRPAFQGLAIIQTLQHRFLAETCAEILLEARGNPQAEELILKFYKACIKE